MSKIFMGVRLRSLRQERGMTQVALAQALGISPSYLNQLEQDQRPFTVSVLLKVHRVLGVDIQQFSEDEQARLVAQLSDAVAAVPDLPAVPQAELRELAAKLPQLSQALLALHRRHQRDLVAFTELCGPVRVIPVYGEEETSLPRRETGETLA